MDCVIAVLIYSSLHTRLGAKPRVRVYIPSWASPWQAAETHTWSINECVEQLLLVLPVDTIRMPMAVMPRVSCRQGHVGQGTLLLSSIAALGLRHMFNNEVVNAYLR